MKKLLILIFVLTLPINAYSQFKSIDFNVGYGLYYSDFTVLNNIQNIEYSSPFFGKSLELSVDFSVDRDKYIGLGYTNTSNSQIVNGQVILEQGIGLSLDNVKVERELQVFDVHFRKQFQNNLGLTFGAYYYLIFQPDLDLNNFGSESSLFFEISDEAPRSDDFGVFLALDYFVPLTDNVKAGLRGKLFYTLDGIEGFSFTTGS